MMGVLKKLLLLNKAQCFNRNIQDLPPKLGVGAYKNFLSLVHV
jgi:hypothetical protein